MRYGLGFIIPVTTGIFYEKEIENMLGSMDIDRKIIPGLFMITVLLA